MDKKAATGVSVAEVGDEKAVVDNGAAPVLSAGGERREGRGKWYWLYGSFDWYPGVKRGSVEKRLLIKMDLAIVGFCMLQTFLKSLDSSNITNAYNSGMKEDLHLNGNQLNYFVVTYDCGIFVAQIPALLLLSRPRWARWVFPGLELAWGVITFLQSRARNATDLYVIRFFLGLIEAPSFAGSQFILGSWYNPDEIWKRSGFWYIAINLGSIVSGYLQSAAYVGLNNVGGLAGWRWLFIVDGIFTVPIALIGFLTFPGLPSSKKPWFMTEEEHALSQQRMVKQNVKPAAKVTWRVIRRTMAKPAFYLAVSMNLFYNLGSYPLQYMSLFLKVAKKPDGTLRYSIPQVNNIATVVPAVSAIFSFVIAGLVGVVDLVWLFLFIDGIFLFANIVLRIWNVPLGLKLTAYFCLGPYAANNALMFSLANMMFRRDAEERAFTMGTMLMLPWFMNAWYPVYEWPTVSAPEWKTGYTVQIPMLFTLLACCLTSIWYQRRMEKKYIEGVTDGEMQAVEVEEKVEDAINPTPEELNIDVAVPSLVAK